MKKLILSLIIVVIGGITAIAQDAGLVFKGVPIGGSMTSFINQLKSKQFALILKDGAKAFLSGKFTGRDVKLLVMSTETDNTVYGLAAIFDEVDSWQTVLGQYENYKKLYTEKYGEPEKSVEEYGGIYSPTSPINYIGLKNGEILFKTIYITDKGSIILTITNGQMYSSFCLNIIYRNEDNIKANRDAMKEEI